MAKDDRNTFGPPASFIAQKRDGRAHREDELRSWIAAYSREQVADYQMAAWAMAVYLQGMDVEETAALTRAMLESGVVMQWPDDGRPVVDKHSTGGVGDKVSLLLAPLLACCDVRVPMISGRGLGPTGGTLDKLESIPGLSTQLPLEQLQRQVDELGCSIAAASERIAPADRRLYALRDVTATVASIPLITGSIMSKKLAEGLDALVLDVKCGSGAFMKHLEGARELAESLARVGRQMGVPVSALITDMSQPLGRAIGNAVEVDEAVEALEGDGPEDLMEVTLALGAELLVACGVVADADEGRARLRKAIDTGAGRERLARMVAAQGGDLDAPRPLAPTTEALAPRAGVVQTIDTERLGWTLIEMGGGRRRQDDTIDPGVGLRMRVRIGDPIDAQGVVADVFARDGDRESAVAAVQAAVEIGDEARDPPSLMLEQIRD